MATFYYMDTSQLGFIDSIRNLHHNFELYGVSLALKSIIFAIQLAREDLMA